MEDFIFLCIDKSKKHLSFLNKLKLINGILVRLDELIGLHDTKCTIIQTHNLISKLLSTSITVKYKKSIIAELEKLFNTNTLEINNLKTAEKIIENLSNNSNISKHDRQIYIQQLNTLINKNICPTDISKVINILQKILTPNILDTNKKNLLNHLGILFKKGEMIEILKKLLSTEFHTEYIEKTINHFGKLFNLNNSNKLNNMKEVIDILYKICDHSNILNIPDMVVMGEIEEIITNMTSLYLIEQNLEVLPQEIFMLRNLEHITASFNKISYIPPEIIKLQTLALLNLSHNNISVLPELPCNLISIDLSHNKLVEFPILGTNNNLIHIYLDNNDIIKIPTNINTLNIVSLHMSYNKIDEIPINLGYIKTLNILYLAFNNIKIVPIDISKLPVLTKLVLKNNPIQEIHKEIVKMKNIKQLDLRNTKIDPNIELNGYYKCVDIIR